MTSTDEWWVLRFIKEWASNNKMELANLVAELDKERQKDYDSFNVVQFNPNQIIRLSPRDDGTFSLLLDYMDIDKPLVCQTVILQQEDKCLAVC